MKILKKLLKNSVIAVLTIYSIDIILSNMNVYIPINYFSIIFVGIFGFPGVIVLFLLLFKFYW